MSVKTRIVRKLNYVNISLCCICTESVLYEMCKYYPRYIFDCCTPFDMNRVLSFSVSRRNRTRHTHGEALCRNTRSAYYYFFLFPTIIIMENNLEGDACDVAFISSITSSQRSWTWKSRIVASYVEQQGCQRILRRRRKR